jgi:2'-5' RNA ligase
MKATFALLADFGTFNFVRQIAWEAHRNFDIGLDVARLEPHVSLKQPFEVANLAKLETYMITLAASIKPFEIHLTELQAIPANWDGFETGILWLDVEQTEHLHNSHRQVNRELTAILGATPADHDGDEYHFHMTIAIGRQPFEIYQEIVAAYPHNPVDLRFTTREIAMFVYDDDFQLDRGYLTYRKLPLG